MISISYSVTSQNFRDEVVKELFMQAEYERNHARAATTRRSRVAYEMAAIRLKQMAEYFEGIEFREKA